MKRYGSAAPTSRNVPALRIVPISRAMTLLRIDSSARKSSRTRLLTSQFVAGWRRHHPGGSVIDRNLATTLLPPITDAWLATYLDPSRRTPTQRIYLETSDTLIAELKAADHIVIGAPMYNLSISAELKGWIDHVVRQGQTIAFDDGRARGLFKGRQAFVVTARGGSYETGLPRASADFQEPYLRRILQSLGLDITFVHVEHQLGPLADVSFTAAADRLEQVVTARHQGE